eukprot:14114965-Alexandrium_andersonii.AAC.1
MAKDPKIAVSLFCAFRACAETSPNYESKGESARKGRREPDKNDPRPGNGTTQASRSSGVREDALTEGGASASTSAPLVSLGMSPRYIQ